MSSEKVAFITGGNRGLGFETARILAAQGGKNFRLTLALP